MTDEELIQAVIDNVITGDRATTAANLRYVLNEFIGSKQNTVGKDQSEGYLGINSSGNVDVSFIKSSSPVGQFLQDDGAWATVSVVSADPLEAILSNGNATGSQYIELTTETASRVLITDSFKNIVASTTDTSALSNISGSRSNIQGQIDATNWKLSCRAATTANIALTGIQTIDTVMGINNMTVLAKNQSDTTENGPYIMRSGGWARRADFDNETSLAQSTIRIEEGSQANTIWSCQNTNPVTVGADSIIFTEDSSGTTYTGTSGEVAVTGSVISLDTPLATSKTAAKIKGSIANAQVSVGTGSDTIGGSNAIKFENSSLKLNVPAIPGSQEFPIMISVDDDAANFFTVYNPTSADGVFRPAFAAYASRANESFLVLGGVGSDSGSVPAISLQARLVSDPVVLAGGPVSTKPVLGIYNYSTEILRVNADSSIDMNGTARYVNAYSTSGTPSVSTGVGAGTGASISVTGTNKGGVISLTTGTNFGILPGGIVLTVTFNSFTAPNGTTAVISAANSNAPLISASLFVTNNSTSFTISVNSSSILQETTDYSWNYITESF